MQMRTRAWRMGFQAGVAASVDDNNKPRRERASQECTRRSHSAPARCHGERPREWNENGPVTLEEECENLLQSILQMREFLNTQNENTSIEDD